MYESFYLHNLTKEIINIQNEKSKQIVNEYERKAQEKRDQYKKEENEWKEKRNIYLQEKKKCDYDQLDEIESHIEECTRKIDFIHSKNIYPHGQGIYGFALMYHQIANDLQIEWKEYIWTWTLLGYKQIYPEDAIHYIQYQKDIQTSVSLMTRIYQTVYSNNHFRIDFFESDWINIIRKYIDEHAIVLDEKIIFRPPIHSSMKTDPDKDEYYRITKKMLEDDIEEIEEFDFMDFLHLS